MTEQDPGPGAGLPGATKTRAHQATALEIISSTAQGQAVPHPVPHRTRRTPLPSTHVTSFQTKHFIQFCQERVPKDFEAVKEPSDLPHHTALTSHAPGAVRWPGFGATLVHQLLMKFRDTPPSSVNRP